MESFRLLIERIPVELTKELPGIEFQNQMASPWRQNLNHLHPKNAQKGSVMLLLYPSNHQIWTVVFQRTIDNYAHSGQISLPGGKYERGENFPTDTALRETHEEIGVIREDIEVLGSLSPIYIPVSNFSVIPILGYLDYPPKFLPNPSEVLQIIEIPLTLLMNKKCVSKKEIKYDDTAVQTPCFTIDDHHIWGATAMILNEFIELIRRTKVII